MVQRRESLKRIAEYFGKDYRDVATRKKALRSQTLQDICSHLGVEMRGEYNTAKESRAAIAGWLGDDRYYHMKERLGAEKLAKIADHLENDAV